MTLTENDLAVSHEFTMTLFDAAQAREFGSRIVPDWFLEPLRAQVTFNGQRRGLVSLDASKATIGEELTFDAQRAERVESLALTAHSSQGEYREEFDLRVFQEFADQMTGELVSQKQIAADAQLTFHIQGTVRPPHESHGVRIRELPLPVLEADLTSLADHGTPTGPLEGRGYPVYVFQSALDQMREFSWKGRSREGGAWVVGNLYRRPDPPEIVGVIHTTLEARAAEHGKFSLDLTANTFADFTSQLKRRQSRLERQGELPMGFYHTHPFLPSILDGHEACPHCSLRATCNLTSSFFSRKDAQFHLALYGRNAYCVEFVLGMTPREEFDLKMFCYDSGVFRERGFHRIPSDKEALVSEIIR